MKINKKKLVGFFIFVFVIFFVFSNEPVYIHSRFQKINLEDGNWFLYRHDNSSETTVLQIFIRGGKSSQTIDKIGLSFLTSKIVERIAEFSKKKEMLEMGSYFDLTISGDYTLMSLECLSRYLENNLKLVEKQLTNPVISSFSVQKAKEMMSILRSLEKEDLEKLMNLYNTNAFFKGTKYYGSYFGNEDSVKRIEKQDTKTYFKNYYNRNNMTFIVTSDLGKKRIIEMMQNFVGKIKKGSYIENDNKTTVNLEKNHYFVEKKRKQTLISFAFYIPEINEKKFAMSFLLDVMLGKDLGSEIWYLRSKKNLIYGIYSKLVYWKDGGIINIYMKTENKDKEISYKSLTELINNLYVNGINKKDFERHKAFAITEIYRMIETKRSHSYFAGYFDMVGLEFNYIYKLKQVLMNIKIDEFNNYIKKIFYPENRIIVIIGPENINS